MLGYLHSCLGSVIFSFSIHPFPFQFLIPFPFSQWGKRLSRGWSQRDHEERFFCLQKRELRRNCESHIFQEVRYNSRGNNSHKTAEREWVLQNLWPTLTALDKERVSHLHCKDRSKSRERSGLLQLWCWSLWSWRQGMMWWEVGRRWARGSAPLHEITV